MSNSLQRNLPKYVIQIGSNAKYSNFATTDMSGAINAAIKAAPAGCQIILNIGPGEYGLASSIVVPSNTTIIGNDATLIALKNSTSNWACIENADSGIRYSNGLGPQDSNISVSGLTFIISDQHDFGSWFMNAANIDVQNNVYIGGVDGNAFTSVINGVVSNNIAFGQDNVSFDNWNGPVNVTVENNSSYTFGADEGAGPSGWNVLFNSSTAQLLYPGDASEYGIYGGSSDNDGIVDNLFSSNWPESTSTNTDSLLSYGYATSTDITQQGNVDSGLGFTDTGATYSASPMNTTIIEDDEFIGLVQDETNSENVISSLSQNSTPPFVTSNAQISGNLIFGVLNDSSSRAIENEGLFPITTNNADILTNSITSSTINNDAFGTASIDVGNIINSGAVTDGSGVIPNIAISAPAELFLSSDTTIPVTGLSLEDTGATSITLSLTTQFGTLSFPAGLTDIEPYSFLGNSGYVITGILNTINADLSSLEYSGNILGWDDSIEVTATDSNGSTTTRYIPITDSSNISMMSDITTIVPGEIVPESGTTTVNSGFIGSNLPAAPDLNGDTVVASSGNNLIDMNSDDSVVFVGAGDDTIIGGDQAGYITTGQGNTDVELDQSGDYTVAGGSGSLLVNALSGINVLEPGTSTGVLNLGSGLSSVVGGFGALTVNGGTGNLVLSTLPQDGGNADLNLGSGSSTIFALSGNDSISTKTNSSNTIFSGLGSNSILSAGCDLINTGAGSTTINATAGGNDTVNGVGTGSLCFIGGSGSSVIIPSSAATVVAGTGDLNIAPSANSYTLEVGSSGSFTDRNITLTALPSSVDLVGYSSMPVIAESDLAGIFSLTLSDGTTIEFVGFSTGMQNELANILGFEMVPVTNNETYIDVDAISGAAEIGNNVSSTILNKLISSVQPDQTVLAYSTGISNNGVIQI